MTGFVSVLGCVLGGVGGTLDSDLAGGTGGGERTGTAGCSGFFVGSRALAGVDVLVISSLVASDVSGVLDSLGSLDWGFGGAGFGFLGFSGTGVALLESLEVYIFSMPLKGGGGGNSETGWKNQRPSFSKLSSFSPSLGGGGGALDGAGGTRM